MKHWCLRALVLGVVAIATVAPASAQSVLRVARGLASSDITVTVNRAIVVESAQPFTEVSVAQPEIADVSPLSDRSIYIFGRNRGATTLTLLGENGKLITNVTIRVQPDLTELKERLRTLLPNEQIEVRSAAGGLVLSGTVSGKAQLQSALGLARAYVGGGVANMMTVGGTQQVNLKVRVVEMSRSVGKELGVNLGLIGTNNRASPFVSTGNSITLGNSQNTGGAAGAGGALGGIFSGFTNTVSQFGVFGAAISIANNYLLDVQIDALENKGYARMLAEPNIVALSGTEAKFLAGGEFPVPAVDGDGNVSVSFKPIGVSVNFVPTVLDGDLINVQLSAEVSSIDNSNGIVSGGVEISAFSVRRATTTIELRDGQSFAIAGLYQDDFSDAIGQVPWLGDIPVLGALFRSTSYQRGETELVIIVTVNLVTPVDDISQLATPLDRIAIPNEDELFLFGRTEGQANPAGLATQGFDGGFGYVVE